MKNIKTYDEKFSTILDNNIGTISEYFVNGDEVGFNNFMNTEFVELFEDVILDGTVVLMLESWLGDQWNKLKTAASNTKDWIKDKWEEIKTKVSEFIKSIGNFINSSFIGKLFNLIKAKVKQLSAEVLMFFDDMRASIIKNQLVLPGNKVNFKKIISLLMSIFKDDKEMKVDDAALQKISASGENLTKEGLFVTLDSIKINEALTIVNAKFNPIYELIEAPTVYSSGKNAENPVKPEQQNKPEQKTVNIKTFNNIRVGEDGKEISNETIANAGVGIFGKLLTKMGVKSPRAQAALKFLMGLISGIIIAEVVALIVTGGFVVPLGLAGLGAISLASFSISTVIYAILFAFGIFELIVWFRKPYPDIKEYREYLEAWFYAHPDGVRKEGEPDLVSFWDQDSNQYRTGSEMKKKEQPAGQTTAATREQPAGQPGQKPPAGQPGQTTSGQKPPANITNQQQRQQVNQQKPAEAAPQKQGKVNNRYQQLIAAWKEEQKKNGGNTSPGEGTRKRFWNQAKQEVGKKKPAPAGSSGTAPAKQTGVRLNPDQAQNYDQSTFDNFQYIKKFEQK